MSESASSIENILNHFTQFIGKPEDFLVVQAGLTEQLKKSTKDLYDLVKGTDVGLPGEALPELIIAEFDDEQVWQEIELQNDPVVSSLLSDVSHVVASKEINFFEDNEKGSPTKSSSYSDDYMEYEDSGEEEEEEEDLGEDEDDLERVLEGVNFGESDADDESEEEKELKELLDKVEGLQESDDGSMNGSSDEKSEENNSDLEDSLPKERTKTDNLNSRTSETNRKLKSNLKKRKTVVDDTFFKLADMESFLEREDAREERRIRRERNELNEEDESSEDEDEEEVDMFVDISSGDEEGKSGRDLTYADFFDPPDEEESKKKKPEVKFRDREGSHMSKENEDEGHSCQDDSPESEEEEDEDEESEGEDVADILGGAKHQSKSTFEERQERLQKKISELEDMSLAEKPWQLLGEVSAECRPENSLLQEDLDYEHATRQAPVVTEETTKKLEDIIIQRIKDKAWDDVERKEKPKEEVPEYKKRLVLDQEKSKLSLGEVYEQEYLKQQQKEEEDKEDPQHEEISKMMTSLFRKLDALSNFHYTPKQSVPDVKIVSNLPSISMEEVAPVSASDQTLLAPEEIKEKMKQELKGDTEKTITDKKRARREKKARQREKRLHREEKEKLRSKLKPGLGNKYTKETVMKELKKRSKSMKGGVTIIDEEKKKSKSGLTSSSQFFSQLQDEVTTHIQSKKTEAKKRKKIQEKSSKKLKL